MSDLISREAMIKRLQEWNRNDATDKALYNFAMNRLIEQPTVEAKPVVHGKWIYNEYYTWECGNCGFHPFKGFIPKEPGFNYCPNCGCDMRTSAE